MFGYANNADVGYENQKTKGLGLIKVKYQK